MDSSTNTFPISLVISESRDVLAGRVTLNQDGTFEVDVQNPIIKEILEAFLREYYAPQKEIGLRGGGEGTQMRDGKEEPVRISTMRMLKPSDDMYAEALAEKFNQEATDPHLRAWSYPSPLWLESLSLWELRTKKS